jgi:hypothetical protein
MSFFVDPFGLLFFGAILYIVSANFKFSKLMLYALASAILTSFIFGGVAPLYGLVSVDYTWTCRFERVVYYVRPGFNRHYPSSVSYVDSHDVCYPIPSLVRFRLRSSKEIQPSIQVYPNLHRRNLNSGNPLNNTISLLRIQIVR